MTPKVICIRTGEKYGPEYVTHLYDGLIRHTTCPWNFQVIQQSVFPGWWSKLLLFPPSERTIFLDLDVVLTGNVDFLFDYDGDFCIWGDPWNGKWNSSVMSIAPGFGTEVRDKFVKKDAQIMQAFYGDQEFLASVVPNADLWQTVAPGKVKSYKADHLEAGPGDASICVFHGDPKPATFLEGWVYEFWHQGRTRAAMAGV